MDYSETGHIKTACPQRDMTDLLCSVCQLSGHTRSKCKWYYSVKYMRRALDAKYPGGPTDAMMAVGSCTRCTIMGHKQDQCPLLDKAEFPQPEREVATSSSKGKQRKKKLEMNAMGFEDQGYLNKKGQWRFFGKNWRVKY